MSADPLPPGTYTRSDFSPSITFAVADGWYAVQRATGFFDIQREMGSPDVIAVQFANVEGVYDDAGRAMELESADDGVAIIGSNTDLSVLGSSESHMGGQSGHVIEVENTSSAYTRVLQVPAGPLGIDPGRRLWIALFDIDDGVLAILVGGSAQRWEDALTAAEPVLESIAIEG